MIDINTIIQQALEKAITDAVNDKFSAIDELLKAQAQRMADMRNAMTELQASGMGGQGPLPNMGQLRAQFAEDVSQLNIRIDRVNGRVDDWGLVLQGIKETLSGMQERFAPSAGMNEQLDNLRDGMDGLQESIESAYRQINTLDQEVHKGMADMRNGLNNLSERVGEVQQTLGALPEHYAQSEWVNESFADIREAMGMADERIESAHRQIGMIDRDSRSSKLDSDELATTIADLFSDGTLTISIDQV